MRIAGATFYRYSLPLVRPLELRGNPIARRDGLIVSVRTDDGAVGYGEIAPLPFFSGESLDDALAAARRCIEVLKRRNDIGAAAPAALRDRETFPPSVRFGIESALLDLAARTRNCWPAAIFAEAPAPFVPVNALLIGDQDEVIASARAAQSSGYTAVKLKVGRGPIERDIETVHELRRALGAGGEIRLDANRAWSFDDALGFAHAVADCAVAYIEEPIADPLRLAEFAERSPVPIAVDETLQDAGWTRLHAWRQEELLEPFADVPADADPLLRAVLAARAWIVKPTLVGIPLTYLAHLLTQRRRIDADLVLSSSFESGLGIVALANLAACAGGSALPAGLDTAPWFGADTLDAPLPVRGGAIDLAEANAIAARSSPDAWEVVAHG